MNKIKHIFSNHLFKNFTVLVSGTLASQIISLLLMPILTRLYNQEAFGVLAIFQSVLSIAYSVGVLGYHEPIIIEKDEYKAKLIMCFCFILSFLLSLAVVIILFIPLDYFAIYKNLKIVLGMSVFLQLTNLLYQYWNLRKRQFKRNALYAVLQAVSIVVSQYFLFYLMPSYGLVWGLTFGYFISNIYMIIKTKNDMIKPENYRELLSIAKRYVNFPKYFTLANFIESFSNSLPVLFLTPLFSVQSIGLYGLAHKVIFHGTSLISSNVHNIIKSDMAARKGIRQIWPVYSKLLMLNAVIGVVISVFIFFLAPLFFSILFGNAWVEAGYIAKILIPFSFAFLIRGMGSAALRVFEKTKYMLIFAFFSMVVRFMALFIANFYTKDFNTIILIYSLASCVTVLGGEVYLCLCIIKHDRDLLAA
jgi:O-antigen/teichoic acid export membrane protein